MPPPWKARLAAARNYVGLARLFGLDLRALAALRIALALLLLFSLADRARSFVALYSDAGLLPQAEAWNGAFFLPWDGPSFLHPFAWAPDPLGAALLYLGAGLGALALLVGWRTGWATFACWLLLTGLDNRNPLVLNSGDDVLRLFLFWAMFLPLGARFSLDARSPASPWRRRRSNRFVSFATFAFLVQLGSLYFFSALLKSHAAWVTEGDALHYALRLEQFVTPTGTALRESLPGNLLSAGTWWLELLGPLLLFCPFQTGRVRILLFIAFGLLHLGIDATLGIGLFSYVCIAGWMAALPSGFWRWVERALSKRVPPRSRVGLPVGAEAPAPPTWNLVAGFFLGYVLLWNLWALDPAANQRWFPDAARVLGHQLRLNQLWGMFSPAPPRESSWLELAGWDEAGNLHWLRPEGGLLTAPPATPERALTERWRKLHERATQQAGSALPRRYAAWLQANAGVKLVGVRVVWVRKETLPPGQAGTPKKTSTVLAEAGAPPPAGP